MPELVDQQELTNNSSGCSLEDLLGAIDDRDGEREREIEGEREGGVWESVLAMRLDDDDDLVNVGIKPFWDNFRRRFI